MTTYAFDEERRAIVGVWETGSGSAAFSFAGLPLDVPVGAVQHLTLALTRLSAQAWRTYTHPASAADEQEVNSEGWRRAQHREAFAVVAQALAKPNLPSDGVLAVSYNPVEECAHRVGRALHDIGDAELSRLVGVEVQAELDAIERAEIGDLTGRARQALALTRADASPVQVQAADKILNADPLGSPSLFTEVEPAAAAIAAAHWLQAAADVTSETTGYATTQIIEEADSIEAVAHETPTLVLEQLAVGLSPYETVTSLIRGAMIVAEGRIPDLDEFLEHVSEAEMLARNHHDPKFRSMLLKELRTTPLDPKRPAHDLLEDLLDGIRGCWLIYQEDASDDDDFAEEVRAEANANRDRLT
ncbi:hypothetical protein [Actinomadura opuntiae]|uniref:hypothetical protein n=1 Tax=Actinomadura sp. OS1-43 TaxID=604315 RepID=UPI00255A9DD9|nr:hypothetical protein [Actinomadura sp. OS1-43]MDL4819320.1 hypothetical protein [Actinomadura sp. OS1-43]